MSFSHDIPEICILSECGNMSSDENADTINLETSDTGLNVIEVSKDGLTDVEDLSDSGQEENDVVDQIDNLTLGNERERLRNNNDEDMDKCFTDVECYDKSDDEDDVSDYYSESDILVNNYFDNAVQEDQMVTKEVDNDDEDILEEQKRKKAEFYAKKRERKAKRDAAKLFQSSTDDVETMKQQQQQQQQQSVVEQSSNYDDQKTLEEENTNATNISTNTLTDISSYSGQQQMAKPRSASIIGAKHAIGSLSMPERECQYQRSSSLPFAQFGSAENSPKNFTSTNLFKYKIAEDPTSAQSDSMEVNVDRSETVSSIEDIKFGTEKVEEIVWEQSQAVTANMLRTPTDEISDEDLRCVELEEDMDFYQNNLRNNDFSRTFSEDYTANMHNVVTRVIKFSDTRRSLSLDSDNSDNLKLQVVAADNSKDSRPCSSDVEMLLTTATGTSEYETAKSLQDLISKTAEYHTAATSLSSKDSENSSNLNSIEVSETLIESTRSEKDNDDDLLDTDDNNVFDMDEPFGRDVSGGNKMKRSIEMTFQPEPKPLYNETAADAANTEPTSSPVAFKQHKRQESMSGNVIRSVIHETSGSSGDSKKFNEPAVFNLPLASVPCLSKSQIEPIFEDLDAEKNDTIEKKKIVVEPKEFFDVLMPDIKITQHMAPIVDKKFYYPEMELEKMEQEDMERRKTPDSQDSFEMIEEPDVMEDYVVVEEVAREASENDMEGRGIRIPKATKRTKPVQNYDYEESGKDEVEECLVQSAPAKLINIGGEDDEIDNEPFPIEDIYNKPKEFGELINIDQNWIENQTFSYDIDFERQPLEDIKEEEMESSRIGSLSSQKDSLAGSVKGSSSSSDYDVLSGKKFFAKFLENDNQSVSSLQEFEQMEHVISLENRKKILQQQIGSQESLARKFSLPKNAPGDNGSTSSSLKDFENLETSCVEADEIEKIAREKEEFLMRSLNPPKMENIYASRDSLDKIDSNVQLLTSSTDSVELQTKIKNCDTLFDSLEFQQTCLDSLEVSNDSIDDEISQLEASTSTYQRDFEYSDLTTSTNATYQLESADSVMSSSFTSGCSITMAQSVPPLSLSPVPLESSSSESTTKRTVESVIAVDASKTAGGQVREVIEPREDDSEFSHTVHRYVEMAPDVQKVSFCGPNAEQELQKFLEDFQEGEHIHEEETIDADGNRHVTRIIQNRVLVRSESSNEEMSVFFKQSESIQDEHIPFNK